MSWKLMSDGTWESKNAVVAKNDNGTYTAWLSWDFRQRNLLKLVNYGPFKDMATAKREILKETDKYER